jgi:adenylate cyclase
MQQSYKLSDHCIVDHFAPIEGGGPPKDTPRLKVALVESMLRLDRKMHFTGMWGSMWRALGVRRSPKNPNMCNFCSLHWEAGRLNEVSALFADWRGFTGLMRERGPQALRPVVDEFFRRSRDIVVQNDGIVDHFMGDAVLALFGVPIRHDDHVARAVAAAREIQASIPDINRAVGEDGLLSVGIGISSVVVFAGTVGSTSCNDYTALGDAINIASRLQGEAGAGEVLVMDEAFDLVKQNFPPMEARVFHLKGIDEPVRAYTLR